MVAHLQSLWQKAFDSGPQHCCTSSDTENESVKFDGSYTHMWSQGGMPQWASCNPLTFRHEAVKGSITFLKSLVSSITQPPTLPRWITNECGARFNSSGSSSAFAWILFLALRPCKQAGRSLCTDKHTVVTTLIMCTNTCYTIQLMHYSHFNPLAYTDVPEMAGLARSLNP